MRQSSFCRARLYVVILSTFCLCAGSPSTAAAEPATASTRALPQSTESKLDFAKLFDAVVDAIDRNFVDEELLKRMDWRARAALLRPGVLLAPSVDDAARQINSLIAELKTSHTELLTPEDYLYYILLDVLGGNVGTRDLMARRFWGNGPYFPGIGAFTRNIEGRHFVDAVLEGSPADLAGLKYGDEILRIDGSAYSPIAAFRGKIGTAVTLTIRRQADAELQHMAVEVMPIRPTKAFSEATEASARIIERNGKRIGYVHIWASAESNSFKTALNRFEPSTIIAERMARAGIRGLPSDREAVTRLIGEIPSPLDSFIVDIRGKVGGNIGVTQQFFDAMDTARSSYWGNFLSIGRSRDRLGATSPRNPPFRGRSALLISSDSRSAAELMAHGFKRSGFGPLIGTTAAGAVSSGTTYVMPGDLLLYIATSTVELDGQRLEGVGVTPDHFVERPLRYAAGADPVLEAAVDLLSGQASK